jgi:hypothetical protein
MIYKKHKHTDTEHSNTLKTVGQLSVMTLNFLSSRLATRCNCKGSKGIQRRNHMQF